MIPFYLKIRLCSGGVHHTLVPLLADVLKMTQLARLPGQAQGAPAVTARHLRQDYRFTGEQKEASRFCAGIQKRNHGRAHLQEPRVAGMKAAAAETDISFFPLVLQARRCFSVALRSLRRQRRPA